MAGPCVLLEIGDGLRGSNPFLAKFVDLEGRAAFTM